MKHWEKIKLYRQQFETNCINEKEFIKRLKAELNHFSSQNLFAKEHDLLTKIDELRLYVNKLEQQNISLQAKNNELKQLIINKLNTT